MRLRLGWRAGASTGRNRSRRAVRRHNAAADRWRSPSEPAPAATDALRQVLDRLLAARKPVLLVGQGGNGGSAAITRLAERLHCPVLTSTSGRGVLPEDHPLAIRSDLCDVVDINALIAASDLLLALGIKFSHNGARGFKLRIPAQHLIHVDAEQEVLGANYPAAVSVCADVADFVTRLEQQLAGRAVSASAWTTPEIDGWRARVLAGYPVTVEPKVQGVVPATAAKFFEVLRQVVPREGIVVTDSGWHQMLVRRYFEVHSVRGLLLPSNLQSMGFGVPAAIGARLAVPDRPALLVTGDGSLLMSGMALLTAARHQICLPVIVFNDGHYGLIRLQQLGTYGHGAGVDCDGLDLEAFAAATGARYALADTDIRGVVQAALAANGPTLIEVPIGASASTRRAHLDGLAGSTARRVFGRRIIAWLRSQR